MELENKQLEREEQSSNAGYKKFMKAERENKVNSNGSNTTFGLSIKKNLLHDAVQFMEQAMIKTTGAGQSEFSKIIRKLIGATPDGTTNKYFDPTEAAFIGMQLALDTALNPNTVESTVPSRYGGDKRLLQKKTVPELEILIGKTIHKQMSLKYIRDTFPNFFRYANEKASNPTEGGAKPTTAYWESNLFRAIRRKVDSLREEGDYDTANILENHKCWSYLDQKAVGSLVLRGVVQACSNYIQVVKGERYGKSSTELELTEEGLIKEKGIREYVAQYSHDLLPMLIQPVPVTNEQLGGWMSDSLQEPEYSHNGSIVLSDQHLEFINRQARVPFQINPFVQKLMDVLCERELKLGKFHYQTLQDIPSLADELGYGQLDKEQQDVAVRNDPRTKELRRRNTDIYSRNAAKVKSGLIAYQVKDKAQKLLQDEQFFIPMKYDFRGRIYSRVPFISFQSNDAGRYLLRFADKTPVDEDRTAHWLKIGISNAGGNDKLSWEQRIKWFDKYESEIINVGRMMDTGDFSRAYDFLTQDHIDDPFCLAALANEYVKVVVDESQDYTQCFVCVDASCSGTSIFNAWRRNLTGALMTNLVDTKKPADIYTEVWNKIKELAPEGTFRKSHIKVLEKNKLIRKMMKTTYVPAQYASPVSEQKLNLHRFNKILEESKMGFKDDELKALQELWVDALDEVSSINTVVKWFRQRAKEALKSADEIFYRTCNGSLMTLKYPKTVLKRFRSLGYGSALYKQGYVSEPDVGPNTKKLLNAVTANITHATDAAALCEALWDWNQTPFVAIHDAAGFPPGRHLDDALMRLKDGLVTATQYNVWNVFRDENNLKHTPKNAGPIVGDLKDWDQVRNSNYLFS